MKKTPTHFLAIAFIGILLLSCSNTDSTSTESQVENTETFDLDAMSAVIREKTNRFTEAHITKDTAFLNSCFAEDGKSYPPNSEAIVGKQAIAKLNAEWVDYGVYEFTETSTNFYGSKEYLIDEGTYFLRYGPDTTTENGKYMNIWKNVNGTWLLYSNIWNTSESLPKAE